MGKTVGRYKVGKLFRLEITDNNHFSYQRDGECIAAGAALDGPCIIRSSVGAEKLSSQELVHSYKLLVGVERAFKTMKSVDLQVPPVHHRLADRVRAHIFICTLAYCMRWHLERAWAPLRVGVFRCLSSSLVSAASMLATMW